MISDSPGARLLAGLVLSALIAIAARWRRALSPSGTIAAIAVATACSAAGWSWAWILIAFFVSSTILSKAGEASKRARTGDVVEKGGERDMWQVLANGGAFAAIALASLMWPGSIWHAAGAAAIASSTSDTWSTEIGTLSRSDPHSIISGINVAPGVSGGVTLLGTIAQILGAAFMSAIVFAFGWGDRAVVAAIIGGIGGSLIDSVLGATIQGTRWCPHCQRGTERAVHTCGTLTVHSKGLTWLGNDLVNFQSSIGGAMLGLLCLL